MSATFSGRSWMKCTVCSNAGLFKSPHNFARHLREYHCSQEGGSFVCKYGSNGVCSSLPLEGVSDQDYENHVVKHHVLQNPSDVDVRHSSLNNSVGMSPSTSDQPNVVADQGKWTVYSSTQNLPAVLNDPGRSKQKDFFTKTWGDSFVEKVEIPKCPYLPEVTHAHFEPYIKKTSKRYKKHIQRSSSLPQAITVEDPNELFPSLQATKQLAERSRGDLENIPKIFFQPSFNLEDPLIFNTVFPWSQLQDFQLKKEHKLMAQHSGKLLQEKLSHYLDIIEVEIAYQISLRSKAFFNAMSSHDELSEQLAQTVVAVKKLRNKIHCIDDILVKESLQTMKLQRLRQNYSAVFNKLRLMATVHQAQPTIQTLLSSSDFVGALDLIATTQEILAQELAGIHSFRHLSSQLAELEKLIEKMMHADFLRYATADLNRPLVEDDQIMEEERLVAIVFGMLHKHRYTFVDVYRDEAKTTIKAVIKQKVIEAVSQADNGDTEGNLGSLPDQMQLLNFPQWMDLLKDVCRDLLKLLRRIKTVHGIMSDAVDIAGGKAHCPNTASIFADTHEVTNMHIRVDSESSVTIPESDHKRLIVNLKELLTSVCDHAHDRCAKLLSARTKKDEFIEKLSSAEFVTLSRCIEKFAADCEQICGRSSTSLQLLILSQSNRFVTRFHDERKVKLSLILDSERWKQADVPSEFQELVDHIASTGELVIPRKTSDAEFIEEKKAQEFLVVGGEKFAVVGTVLLLLKMIIEYCQCITDIPAVTSNLLSRLVELLKTFNSRTCQLVLGAGALQLVGLKTITTKNLALASRCLQLIVHYIPIVKSHFSKKLTQKHTSMNKHFDQVLKDYNDHIQEISNKLVAIIDVMFDSQLEKWEVKPPVPSVYFRAICRQLSKLHEAIAELLPKDQIKSLFIRIHESFKNKLRQQLQKLNVVNDGGPQQGLVTSELAFYRENLKSLNCFGDELDLNMDNIWLNRSEGSGLSETFSSSAISVS